MESSVVYPIVLEKTDDKNAPYLVHVPDFEGMTQGADIADALNMAHDYIALAGVQMQNDGLALPSPTPLNNVVTTDEEIKTLVLADLAAYRAKLEKRTVRTTVTIPSWLVAAAKKEQINFSATLTEALQEKLGLSIQA
ncbi:MAG: type II toxin-antitoxin system HicB family antitoxin [Coriobacteriia bacterium]|nr:type II toxin-antitoxin system HicB family antitoxin [Coriobacteriia bacterium]